MRIDVSYPMLSFYLRYLTTWSTAILNFFNIQHKKKSSFLVNQRSTNYYLNSSAFIWCKSYDILLNLITIDLILWWFLLERFKKYFCHTLRYNCKYEYLNWYLNLFFSLVLLFLLINSGYICIRLVPFCISKSSPNLALIYLIFLLIL